MNAQAIGVGDQIVTLRYDRRTLAGTEDWVRSGDRWTVTATSKAGHLRVESALCGTALLSGDYVAEHVALGYALSERAAVESVAGRDGRTPDEHWADVDALLRPVINERFGIDPTCDRRRCPSRPANPAPRSITEGVAVGADGISDRLGMTKTRRAPDCSEALYFRCFSCAPPRT